MFTNPILTRFARTHMKFHSFRYCLHQIVNIKIRDKNFILDQNNSFSKCIKKFKLKVTVRPHSLECIAINMVEWVSIRKRSNNLVALFRCKPIKKVNIEITLSYAALYVEGICRFRVEFLYIYLTRSSKVAKNTTMTPLAGIEPAALRFRCSGSNQLSYRETVVKL